MSRQENSFPFNWLYVGFVVLISSSVLSFMAWQIDVQFYRDWSTGKPVKGDWGWPSIAILNLAAVGVILALLRKVYRDLKTIIGKQSVSQPHFFGRKELAWSEVTDLRIYNGVGYHIISPQQKIVITPYAYKNPDAVIETIIARINEAKHQEGKYF